MKRILCALLCAVVITSFTACSSGNTSTTDATSQTPISTQTSQTSSAQDDTKTDEGYDLSFSARDSDLSYDENSACKITFANSSASVSSGNGATADGSTVTINSEGTYIISGECSDGQIVVDVADTDKVQIVLNGVNLTSSTSPFLIKQADKVFVTLADKTENTFSDNSSYSLTLDDSTVDGAIFSKADLTINGSGTLNVNGNYKHAIVSKDDMKITGGTLNVKSAGAGIDGKDCVKIKDATISVTSTTDAIRSTNVEDTTTKGFVYIESGTFNLNSTNDALQSSSLLRIDDGTFTITTGGGSSNGATHTDSMGGMDRFSSSSDSTDTASSKALKAADNIKVMGGTFDINSSDDAIHSNNNATISGGTFNISTGDDGVHASATLTIDNGTIDIAQCYEGIEAGDIIVNDGKISLVSSDDGFNAAGGSDGNVEQGAFSANSNSTLTINGGYVFVDAEGDGLDSNGSLSITGGVTLVCGPENSGNGSLDYDSSATISGGVLVALGSSGMAQSITGDNQCTIMTDITSQNGSSFALCDSSGKVLASLTSSKSYSSVVASTPDITSDGTYTIKCGATVSGADENGYASSSTASGGTEAATITMTSDNYSSGSGMGGNGGGGFGGMGGRM